MFLTPEPSEVGLTNVSKTQACFPSRRARVLLLGIPATTERMDTEGTCLGRKNCPFSASVHLFTVLFHAVTGSPRYHRLLLSSPFTFLLLLSGVHAAAASPPPPLHVGDSGGAVSARQSEDEDVLLWSEEAHLTMDTE